MKTFAPAIVILLVVVALFLFVPGLKERPWTASRIAGAIVAVLGYILVVTAWLQLGKSFSIGPQAKELVTAGLYSRIRNPMYVFLDVMLIGLAVALHMYSLLAVVVVLFVAQSKRGRQEAAVLKEKFGQAYLDYRKQTWF